MKKQISKTIASVLAIVGWAQIAVSQEAAPSNFQRAFGELQEAVKIIPDFMLVPESAWTQPNWDERQLPYGSHDFHAQAPATRIGLRIFPFDGDNRLSFAADDVHYRNESARALAKSGVLQDGDILLTFRPEAFGTTGYFHVQMGIMHASLVTIDRRDQKNPIVRITELLSRRDLVTSNLDFYPVYSSVPQTVAIDEAGTTGNYLRFLHIVRPYIDGKPLTNNQRANIRKWAELAATHRDRIRFQGDYTKPKYNETEGHLFVTRLARIAKGIKDDTIDLFCLEFVYAVLSLRDCEPKKFDSRWGALNACVKPPFEPMIAKATDGAAGLVDGPELIFRKMGLSEDEIVSRLNQHVFLNNPEYEQRAPRAHADIIHATKPLFNALHKIHNGGSFHSFFWRNTLNSILKPNYSPTGYMVQALAARPTFKYVGTIHYFQTPAR